MAQVDVSSFAGEHIPAATFRTYAPEIGPTAVAYSGAVYQHSKLSLRELEAARYRTALINGCVLCEQFRGGRDIARYLKVAGKDEGASAASRGPAPDEAFYQNMVEWRAASDYSERERICIEFAERMGEAPKSLHGDEIFWRRTHEHFTDAEIVDLTLSTASWIALGRAVHVLELDEVCEVSFGAQAA